MLLCQSKLRSEIRTFTRQSLLAAYREVLDLTQAESPWYDILAIHAGEGKHRNASQQAPTPEGIRLILKLKTLYGPK